MFISKASVLADIQRLLTTVKENVDADFLNGWEDTLAGVVQDVKELWAGLTPEERAAIEKVMETLIMKAAE